MRLEVNLDANLAYWGNDVVSLAPLEAEMLYALCKAAPHTATYAGLARAVYGKRVPPGMLARFTAMAARLRVKIAPWGFAILCETRTGYRLIHDPVQSGKRKWRGDEELLLCKLVAEGLGPTAIAARLPRHSVESVKQKLARLRRGMAAPVGMEASP